MIQIYRRAEVETTQYVNFQTSHIYPGVLLLAGRAHYTRFASPIEVCATAKDNGQPIPGTRPDIPCRLR